MIELEQKSKEWVQKNACDWCINADECEQGCIDCHGIRGYIAGATENGIQWHDLRKDPNDLPDTDRIVHVQTMSDTGKAYHDDEGWHSSQIGGIVIAWCEEPQFKE